jgi:hypothetical protein
MQGYKNFFTSKTIIALLVALVMAYCNHNNIQLPFTSTDSEVTKYGEYIALLLAVIFRHKANKKTSL